MRYDRKYSQALQTFLLFDFNALVFSKPGSHQEEVP